MMRWHPEGLSEWSNSQDSVLMFKSFRETFRLSRIVFIALRPCAYPDRVLRRVVALECDRLAWERHGCSFQLDLAHDGNDAEKVCLLQDQDVGHLVLPANVEKVPEASEMDVVLSLTFLILGT